MHTTSIREITIEKPGRRGHETWFVTCTCGFRQTTWSHGETEAKNVAKAHRALHT